MAITPRARLELSPDSFTRKNDIDDRSFYADNTPAAFFDQATACALERILASVVHHSEPAVLDLWSGAASHFAAVAPGRVVGIGPAAAEMQANEDLDERIDHDLNANPKLPFPDATFDVVTMSGAAPYLKRAVELFAEAARVLKPGGQFLAAFTTEFDDDRVVKFWRRAGEDERLALVNYYFQVCRGFDEAQVRVSPARGEAKPVLVTYATRAGSPSQSDQLDSRATVEQRYTDEEIAARKKQISSTMRCPYCDHPLTKFKVPDVPFCEWDAEYMWVCFAEDCPFTLRSLAVMREQGNLGVSYRIMYHRERDKVYTVPDVGFCEGG